MDGSALGSGPSRNPRQVVQHPEPEISTIQRQHLHPPALDSLESLLTQADEPLWNTRVSAFENILDILTVGESISEADFDRCLDCAIQHLNDTHIKVVILAVNVLETSLQSAHLSGSNRKAPLIIGLFQKLADSRNQIRDMANNLLNRIRSSWNPVTIFSLLSPRLTEFPDRMKTALVQYLGVIAPYCGEYFAQSHQAMSFLVRMANVLGASGAKPSNTLLLTGKRLLELVYQTAPKVP